MRGRERSLETEGESIKLVQDRSLSCQEMFALVYYVLCLLRNHIGYMSVDEVHQTEHTAYSVTPIASWEGDSQAPSLVHHTDEVSLILPFPRI